MTIGMLIEMLTGKKVCIGKVGKTPLNKVFCLDREESERTLGKDIYDIGSDNEVENNEDEFNEDYEVDNVESSIHSSFKDDHDATPFSTSFSLSKICKELTKYGYNQFGDEMMINGMTGEMMPCLIYTGVCYYQRLRHMVIDKIHARSRGGRNLLTRQPFEGRKQGGGFRCGTMEKDCMIGQGVPSLVKDRLMDQSDSYQTWVCRYCGIQAVVVRRENQTPDKYCKLCDSKDVVLVKIPYSTKLVSQEFSGMNIIPRILTKPFEQ